MERKGSGTLERIGEKKSRKIKRNGEKKGERMDK
jgi:hypothetical protein